VGFAKHYKVIEALISDRLDEALSMRITVWAYLNDEKHHVPDGAKWAQRFDAEEITGIQSGPMALEESGNCGATNLDVQTTKGVANLFRRQQRSLCGTKALSDCAGRSFQRSGLRDDPAYRLNNAG